MKIRSRDFEGTIVLRARPRDASEQNDAKPDSVAANYDSNDLSVSLGRRDGTFAAETTLATGSSPRWVVVADLDENTIPDLITANEGSSNGSVVLGHGDGTF